MSAEGLVIQGKSNYGLMKVAAEDCPPEELLRDVTKPLGKNFSMMAELENLQKQGVRRH